MSERPSFDPRVGKDFKSGERTDWDPKEEQARAEAAKARIEQEKAQNEQEYLKNLKSEEDLLDWAAMKDGK